MLNNILFKLFLITLIFSLANCGIYRKTDVRETPINSKDRVRKNIEEGRGFRLMGGDKKEGGVFEFASSNAMWQASINLLDFVPLTNVDYSGGIIITDWFSEENSNDQSLKITVRFLSNEIRSDGLDILVHKKSCSTNNNCKVAKLENNLPNEIKSEILKQATMIKQEIPNPNPEYRPDFNGVMDK